MSRFQALRETLQLIDQKTRCSDTGIFVMGLQGCGKTCLSLLLAGIPLKDSQLCGQEVLVLNDQSTTSPIADGSEPSCCYPNLFPIGQVILYDCPAFNQSSQNESRIAEVWLKHQLFTKVPRNKFVIVVTQPDVTSTRAGLLRRTIQKFLDCFDLEQETVFPLPVKNIAEKCLLVVNKCGGAFTVETAKEHINHKLLKKGSSRITEFMSSIIQQKNIYLIKKFVNGEPFPEVKAIRERIQNLSYFNTRKESQNGVQWVKFQLKNEYTEKFIEESVKDINQICECLKLSQISLLLNINNDEYKHTFFTEWESTIKKLGSNPPLRYELKMPAKYPYFGSLKIFQKFTQKFLNLNRSNLQFNDLMNIHIEYLKDLSSMISTTAEEFTIIEQILFILYRRTKQVRLMNEFGGEFMAKVNIEKQNIGVINPQNQAIIKIEKLEEDFISKLVIKPGVGIGYYQQAIQLIKKYITKNPELINKIITCYYEKGLIHEFLEQWSEAIKSYLLALDFSQSCHLPDFVDVGIYTRIADLCLSLKLYRSAVDFYKVLDHTGNLISCYHSLIKIDSPYRWYLELGDYLKTVLMFEGAMEAYRRAAESVTDNKLQIEALEKMFKIDKVQSLQTFQDKISKKIVFQKNTAGFVQEKLLAEVRAEEIRRRELN